MTYLKKSNINIEKNNQTSTTIDTSNIRTIDMTARYGNDENSMPKPEVTVLDLNEAAKEMKTVDMSAKYGIDENSKPQLHVEYRLNDTNQEQQIPESQMIIQNVHDDLSNKTIISTRPAEGDELAYFTEITTYSDGTTVMTGLNQEYFPGANEYIIIPLDDNGLSRNIIIKDEPGSDNVVLIETINLTTIEEDPTFGQMQQTKQLETTRYFEGTEDGKVKEITNVDAEYNKRTEYVNNPNGISAIEDYNDRRIIYYEDGRQLTII